MMHANEPAIPMVAASISLASISHRTYPGNQPDMLSVGHMRALVKFIRLVMMVQEMRLQAATLRFFACHTRGGMSKTRAMNARVGKAIDAGLKLVAAGSMIDMLEVVMITR